MAVIRSVLKAVTRRFRKAGAAPAGVRITVNVPAGVSSADIGRAVVRHVREYERRGGGRWR